MAGLYNIVTTKPWEEEEDLVGFSEEGEGQKEPVGLLVTHMED